MMGGMVGSGKQLREYIQQLKHRAMIDSLTNLYNRATFFELVDREISISKRYNRHLAFLMLDLDNFKLLNDELGHLAGDKYLRTFGNFLISNSRESDVVGRLGGDEFAILLPETTLKHANEAAKRLQANFETNSELQKAPVTIGLSIGIAQDGKHNATQLYNKADGALIRAKKRGINQIAVADEEKAA